MTERYLAMVADALPAQRLEITAPGLKARQREHFQGKDPLSTLIRDASYRTYQTQLLDDLFADTNSVQNEAHAEMSRSGLQARRDRSQHVIEALAQNEAYAEFSKMTLGVLRARGLYKTVMEALETTPVLVNRGIRGGVFHVVAVDDADLQSVNSGADDIMTLGGARFSAGGINGVVVATDVEEWWLGYSYDLIESQRATFSTDNLLGLLKRTAIRRLIDIQRGIGARRKTLRTTDFDERVVAPGGVENVVETTSLMNQVLTLIARSLNDPEQPAPLNVRIGLIIFLYLHAGAPAEMAKPPEEASPPPEDETIAAVPEDGADTAEEDLAPDDEVPYQRPHPLRAGKPLNREGITKQPEVSNSVPSIWDQLQTQADVRDGLRSFLERMLVTDLGADADTVAEILHALTPATQALQTPGLVGENRAKRAFTDFKHWWREVEARADLASAAQDVASLQ